MERKKGKPRTLLRSSDQIKPSWPNFPRTRGFPLLAALMLVAVMALVVGMLMAMDDGLMPMLVAVVGMGLDPMGVFVLMFIFVVTAHTVSPPFYYIFNIL